MVVGACVCLGVEFSGDLDGVGVTVVGLMDGVAEIVGGAACDELGFLLASAFGAVVVTSPAAGLLAVTTCPPSMLLSIPSFEQTV